MRNRRLRGILSAGLVAAAILMAACGSDDGGDKADRVGSASVSEGATSVASQPIPPLPTVADLNDQLQRGLDPNVPLPEKVGMVQGSDQDPEMINKVAQAAKAAGLVVEVIGVTDQGSGRFEAAANFIVNGTVNPAVVPFVAEDGMWKMEQAYACSLVQAAQLQSAACA